MDQVLAQAKIAILPTSKVWDGQRAYERKLGTAASKSRGLFLSSLLFCLTDGVAAKGTRGKQSKTAEVVTTEDDEPMEDVAEKPKKTAPKPRPRRAAAVRTTRARKAEVDADEEEDAEADADADADGDVDPDIHSPRLPRRLCVRRGPGGEPSLRQQQRRRHRAPTRFRRRRPSRSRLRRHRESVRGLLRRRTRRMWALRRPRRHCRTRRSTAR
jgi:hypothetical protein